jgi:hypothetical protein
MTDRQQNHVEYSDADYSRAFTTGIGPKLAEANRLLALAASAHEAANRWRVQATTLIADVETEFRMQSVQAEIAEIEDDTAEVAAGPQPKRDQLVGVRALLALAKRDGGASREALQIAGGMSSRLYPSTLKSIAARNGLMMREVPGPNGMTFYQFV